MVTADIYKYLMLYVIMCHLDCVLKTSIFVWKVHNLHTDLNKLFVLHLGYSIEYFMGRYFTFYFTTFM